MVDGAALEKRCAKAPRVRIPPSPPSTHGAPTPMRALAGSGPRSRPSKAARSGPLRRPSPRRRRAALGVDPGSLRSSQPPSPERPAGALTFLPKAPVLSVRLRLDAGAPRWGSIRDRSGPPSRLRPNARPARCRSCPRLRSSPSAFASTPAAGAPAPGDPSLRAARSLAGTLSRGRGRLVDYGAALEMRFGATRRGFESRPLRHRSPAGRPMPALAPALLAHGRLSPLALGTKHALRAPVLGRRLGLDRPPGERAGRPPAGRPMPALAPGALAR